MPTTASSQGRFRVTRDRYELAPRVCSALRSIPPTDLPNPMPGCGPTDFHGAASYGNAVPYAELMAVSSFPTIGLRSDEERRPELQAGGMSSQRPAVVAGACETTAAATAGPSSPITQMPTAAASSTGASFRPMPMALRAGSLNSLPFRQQRLWSAFTKKSEYSNAPGPPAHDDLVARDFPAGSPEQIRVADITEHPTREGKLSRCTGVAAPTGTPSHSTTRRARGKHAGSIDGARHGQRWDQAGRATPLFARAETGRAEGDLPRVWLEPSRR